MGPLLMKLFPPLVYLICNARRDMMQHIADQADSLSMVPFLGSKTGDDINIVMMDAQRFLIFLADEMRNPSKMNGERSK